jgi:hypothetical protein
VYAQAVEAVRRGASYLELDHLICAAITARGISVEGLEWIGFGIPMPAYGVVLDDLDCYTEHPDTIPVLACFGISPQPNPYQIDVPDCAYTAGRLIAADLQQHADARYRQIAWLLHWLFSCSGNSVILCGIESPLSSTSWANRTITIPDYAYQVAQLLAADLEAHADIRYRRVAWLLLWLFSSTNNACLDWDDETMYSVEPLRWEPDDVAFAVEIMAEAKTILADIQSALTWLQDNPVVLVGLALNAAQLYQALAKHPQKPPQLTFHWFDPDHDILDEVLGRIKISDGKIKVTSRSSADPS